MTHLSSDGIPNENDSEPKSESIWPIIPMKMVVKAIEDPLEFKPNKCSPRARLQHTSTQNFHYELWIDQHYHSRQQLGDDNGKREGIEPETVESLIRRGFKHLILYSTLIKDFVFINYVGSRSIVRVVLQENTDSGMLCVPIEAHFVAINKFEITVLTAMRSDFFKIQEGQYLVELEEDGSVLKKFQNKNIVEILRF